MNCNQCQEVQNNACNTVGTCGKTDILDKSFKALRNFIIDLAIETNNGKYENLEEIDKYITDSLFLQITNVNFNTEDVESNLLDKGAKLTNASTEKYLDVTAEVYDFYTDDKDIRSVKETIYYGLKGLCAYHHHANNLNYKSKEIFNFARNTLEKLKSKSLKLEDYVKLMLETGEHCVNVMKLLDEANTTTYGNPVVSEVNIGVGKNPGILISGHDLSDMKQLLDQTKDSGVDVYTHSEMLSAHYYPELRECKNLVGNYGNAWHDQLTTFEEFNGPVIFTTNCLVPPKKSTTYNDRVFTTGVTGMSEWKKVKLNEDGTKDFSEIIALAKTLESPNQLEEGKIVGGFAHNQVSEYASKIIELINEGKISKFVVMAGCDGRQSKRNYYTEFASRIPSDAIILTAGCAKYRYNKLDLGNIEGIPRVLDAGQCNDSYSLAVTALTLASVLECDVNDLPIVYNIAWYEQKAITVFLALLSLGVKNIKIGPTLPKFLSPNVVDYLVKEHGVSTISTVEADIEELFN